LKLPDHCRSRPRTVTGSFTNAAFLPPDGRLWLGDRSPGCWGFRARKEVAWLHFAARRGDVAMAESVYKVIELVGTSAESWEKAASAAVTKAAGSLRDLRIAEVVELDLQLEEGQVKAYRARVKVSFKYEGGD
jgi:flavin-binding protein dodecin